MVEVSIVGDRLRLEVQGLDELWSLKSQLELPLDFRRADDAPLTDPAFLFLIRAGDAVVLSSYSRRGAPGSSTSMILTAIPSRSLSRCHERPDEGDCCRWTSPGGHRCRGAA